MRSCLCYRVLFLDELDEDVVKRRRNAYMEFASLSSIRYQWFKDFFKLWVQAPSKGPVSLFGFVDCGECIEDEWFIVWILLELSKFDPRIIIQVSDEDGEFLLIECADHLPKWLNPENAENRVWLYQGKLNILCKNRKDKMALNDALHSFKVFNASDFLLSSAIQSAIQKRIMKYPDSIETAHLAHITVPYSVAAIFTTFYSKCIINSSIDILADKISDGSGVQSWLKLFNKNLTIFANHCMNKGGPRKHIWPKLTELSKSYVTIPVWFSRLRYARLRSLPTPGGMMQPQSNNTASGRLAAELGLKLCIGLDLLLNHVDSHTQNSQFTPNFVIPSDSKEKWDIFFERLNRIGYFQGVAENSWLYRQLQNQTECHFLYCLSEASSKPPAYVTSDDFLSNSHTKGQLQEHSDTLFSLLNYIENNESCSSLVDKINSMEGENGIPPADDESWMFITPEELDEMLLERNGTNEPNLPCNSISSILKDFMNSSSSFKGIEPRKHRRGIKRKPEKPGNLSSDGTSSDEDTTADESENGYCEYSHPSIKGKDDSMNMGDIMKSLLEANDKILSTNSKPKSIMKSSNSLNNKENNNNVSGTINPPQRKVYDVLTSDGDDDDELIDLYGVRSEYPAYFEDCLSSSSADSIKISKDSGGNQQKQIERKSPFSPKKVIPKSEKPICFSSSSDEDRAESRHVSSKTKKSFSMKKYFSQLEDELENEPANIGRYTPTAHKSSMRHHFSAYRKTLCSTKKPRKNIQLAEPEDTSFFEITSHHSIDSSEDTDSTPESCIETSESELDQHVARNIGASIKDPENQSQFQPSGPAAHLLSAIGLPVHELFRRQNINNSPGFKKLP
ncbi:unnamed protein product [Trichobilharzia szidati]|nr:unnamed protein product [Trichobilharzia szidati]